MSEGLAQGPYVAAKVRFKPATLWMQGTELTTEPPHPTSLLLLRSSVAADSNTLMAHQNEAMIMVTLSILVC